MRLGHLVERHDDRHRRERPRPPAGPGHRQPRMRSATMPPTISSTNVPTIGLRSSAAGPRRTMGSTFRHRRRYGLTTSATKPRNALSVAVVGHARDEAHDHLHEDQDHVDEHERVDVVRHVGPVDGREQGHRASVSTTRSTARVERVAQARCPPAPARPFSVRPPGVATRPLSSRGVEAVRVEVGGGARHGLAPPAGWPARGSRPCRAPASASASTTSARKAGPQLMSAIAGSIESLLERAPPRRRARRAAAPPASGPSAASVPGRVAEHPAPDLDRDVGDEAVDRHPRVGGLEPRDRTWPPRSTPPPCARAADLLGHLLGVGGLVAEHHQVGCPRPARRWSRPPRPPISRAPAPRRARLSTSRHERRLTEPARERRRHAARPDEPDLIRRETYSERAPAPGPGAA